MRLSPVIAKPQQPICDRLESAATTWATRYQTPTKCGALSENLRCKKWASRFQTTRPEARLSEFALSRRVGRVNLKADGWTQMIVEGLILMDLWPALAGAGREWLLSARRRARVTGLV